MKISEVKKHLENLDQLVFILPDGKKVPSHFHVTEIAKTSKTFIDCGGTVRQESMASFQLWSSIDIHHRLQAKKLKDIIALSETAINLPDLEIEVEYQGENTIEKFALDFDGHYFVLKPKHTDCLAKSNCGIPAVSLSGKIKTGLMGSSCSPGSGCC